ncbi:4810_t:CDS:2 [Ambispora gerdemannii]|uniref:4810_t:CDS:1 n=1 Tax=Ambispora gerdemannii TaxID=144530 RepID=A0A9N8ZJY1_9GLOM|nr:4810_t:CDS:2 [Ambispora gerdemannii]
MSPSAALSKIPHSTDLTSKQLSEVQKWREEIPNGTTWSLFTTNHVIYFLALYLMSKTCERIIRRYINPNLSLYHVKNCTTYVLEIIWTTIALGLQLSCYRLMTRDFNYRDYQVAQIIGVILIDLYIFELLYRPVMRIPLVMHHFTTIFLVIYGSFIVTNCENIDLYAQALILLFQASTEQSTFIGLLFYRVLRSWSSWVLFFSVFQVFAVKFGALIWCYVYWGKSRTYVLPNKDHEPLITGFNVVYPAGGLVLFGTQIWSTYVVWKIASRSRRDQRELIRAPEIKLEGSFESDSTKNQSISNFEMEQTNMV